MSDFTRSDEQQEKLDREEFQVGGIDRKLSAEQQLEQLATYIYAHYDLPEKNPPWSENPSVLRQISVY